MTKRRKLTEAEWRLVFRLRCKSKQGGKLSKQELALVDSAYKEERATYPACYQLAKSRGHSHGTVYSGVYSHDEAPKTD